MAVIGVLLVLFPILVVTALKQWHKPIREGYIMAFMGVLLVLFPILAVTAGLLLAAIYALSACLVVMGASGLVMNGLHKKLSPSAGNAVMSWCNITAIVIGLALAIIPLAFAVFSVVSIFLF